MRMREPLAEQLRPSSLSDIVGQDHITGPKGILSAFIQQKFLPSIIFWGPPGVGKTSVAKLLSTLFDTYFESKSAVSATVSDIRKGIDEADKRYKTEQKRTILFIDEIHRFNKSQQDTLLHAVEHGILILIGATTENPSFEIISPLLSRCRVITLKQLESSHLGILLSRGLKVLNKTITKDAQEALIGISNKDGRQLLTILEIAAVVNGDKKEIAVNDVLTAAQTQVNRYDQNGEEHYNTISAFIKSMRAGDVNASLYYLARMVHAGEDPLFIARRMIIFAAEDIGIIQPTALVVAQSVFDSVQRIGYPEAQIVLAFGVTYLSSSKKSRRAHDAYFEALQDVIEFGNLPIPLQLRNAPTQLMKNLGYGKEYTLYSKDSLLPDKLKNKTYFK